MNTNQQVQRLKDALDRFYYNELEKSGIDYAATIADAATAAALAKQAEVLKLKRNER